MPGDEARAGGRHVAHAPQRPAVAAGNAGAAGGDGGDHLATAQALGRVLLVVQAQLQQLGPTSGEGRHGIHEPGGERVGVHRQLQRGGGCIGQQAGVAAAQLVLQQRHLLQMQAQALAGLGTGAGAAALHQHLAQALFELLDALRHGRGRDMQAARRALEAALVQHGGQGLETGVVQHAELLNIV